MKKSFLVILVFLAISLNLYSQKHELGVGINTGYSFFTGSGSESSTMVHYSDYVYTNSPLGKKFVLSYGLSVDYRYVFRNNLLLGVGVSYEDLRTKVSLTEYSDYEGLLPTKGRTFLFNHFFTATPMFGYRFDLIGVSLDALVGLDVAYPLDIEEKIKFKDKDGNTIKANKSRKDSYIDIDLRPRIQLNVNYKNYTFFTAASFGVMDYYSGWDGGNDQAYLNTIRLGIQYRVF